MYFKLALAILLFSIPASANVLVYQFNVKVIGTSIFDSPRGFDVADGDIITGTFAYDPAMPALPHDPRYDGFTNIYVPALFEVTVGSRVIVAENLHMIIQVANTSRGPYIAFSGDINIDGIDGRMGFSLGNNMPAKLVADVGCYPGTLQFYECLPPAPVPPLSLEGYHLNQLFQIRDTFTWNGALAVDCCPTSAVDQTVYFLNGTSPTIGRNYVFPLTTVPEPSTFALLAIGCIVLLIRGRRKDG